ncbi:acyl-CoA dehydrogenase family protein (plasmid) [Rhodococcus sp. ZPP]|uniref:acyl-CoA dehydrogenase family protein n=1 Tax=Rhodococcus sp. ZPP TaxID=2749906 RepID=UPI001AD863E3|nr:acyl-CoA dehydrogenase family protein [Rhodococcus sp. ZPP]QTJ70392.1 acyl-CoA dehydrogenase family protein [Rhodococcus sp. ZPP]
MYAASPDEDVELARTVRRFTQTVVKPRTIEIDHQNKYPDDVFKALLGADLLGLATPEEFGGSGAGTGGLTIAIEESRSTPTPLP